MQYLMKNSHRNFYVPEALPTRESAKDLISISKLIATLSYSYNEFILCSKIICQLLIGILGNNTVDAA